MEWIEWLEERPFYRGQLAGHRTVPGREAVYEQVGMDDAVASALEERGIDRLYAHQARAVRAVRDGGDAVLATPTASGKSLGYGIPALERAAGDGGRTLYIAPQNALIEDQESWLSALGEAVGGVTAAQYTGRMRQSEKRETRDREPDIVLTTPDMLHYGLLPHARRLWDWLFADLSLVAIDEVHAYRGIFGSQVALVLRRLDRLARGFGARPQFVCCSATIGNPVAHAAGITGRPADRFRLVDMDTSETGPRTWAFWQPPETPDRGHGRRRSAHVESMQLFVELVRAGYQTLVFGRSRQLVERYALESQNRLREGGDPDLAEKVRAYEAALTHERRTELERGIHDGSIRGVWSTSALELGVDIGDLDAVILDGYPGTRTDTHQRAGRAGRGTDPCLVTLVGGEDQLDEYVLAHPDAILDGTPESAVVNPQNSRILPAHLRCAARESWLTPDDRDWFGDEFPDAVRSLVDVGTLARRTDDGGPHWIDDGEDSPHHTMNLRRAGGPDVALVRRDTGDTIARLDRGDAMRDAHTGAIYHHQGQAYEVVELDLESHRAELSPTWADHYTRIRHDKNIAVEDFADTITIGDETEVLFGRLTVRTRITGYARKHGKTGRTIGEEPLDMPETSLETEGLAIAIPPHVQSRFTADADFLGGIHAAEHGLISLFPLEVLCDRGDVGGLSIPHHPATDRGTIFVYDGHEGGVGLTRGGFDRIEALLARTRALIAECDCVDGCPSCVQSPQCGNGNEPLDPDTAVDVLRALAGEDAPPTRKP